MHLFNQYAVPRRVAFLLMALLMALSACTAVPPATDTLPSSDSSAEDPTWAPTDGVTTPSEGDNGVLTLPTETAPSEPEPVPPLAEPDPAADYGKLVITSYYAPGKVAGKAMVAAGYVELHNGSNTPVSLNGLSLYVSDQGGDFTEYRFAEGDVIPAEGFFLIRGADANGAHENALSVDSYDKTFKTLSPDPKSTRICLGLAGMTLPTDRPLSELAGLFSYVTSHPLDAADTYHYVDSGSVNKVIRKKADTHKTDYQSIHLGKASYTVLTQITPRTAEGRVNTAVESQIPEVIFSHPSGVYEKGFDLTLTAPEGYTVYYSINNTDPRLGVSMVYKTPLHLSDTTEMTWGELTAMSATFLGKAYDPLTATFPGRWR
jgi:hypothetical protein